MGTINELIKRLPFMAMEALLKQLKDKLQDAFQGHIEEETKSVVITKLPLEYKDNIAKTIADMGFTAIVEV